MVNMLAVDDEKIRGLQDVRLRRKGHHAMTASYGQKGIELSDELEKPACELGVQSVSPNGFHLMSAVKHFALYWTMVSRIPPTNS